MNLGQLVNPIPINKLELSPLSRENNVRLPSISEILNGELINNFVDYQNNIISNNSSSKYYHYNRSYSSSSASSSCSSTTSLSSMNYEYPTPSITPPLPNTVTVSKEYFPNTSLTDSSSANSNPVSAPSSSSSATSSPSYMESPNLNTDNSSIKKFKKKRSNLPKKTTIILINWLNNNLNHPYPNSFEKNYLMNQTGLNNQQLSNWFINARRRKIGYLKEIKEKK